MPNTCAHPDCERKLRSDNASGACESHRRWAQWNVGRPERQTCGHAPCDRLLDRDNVYRFCRAHTNPTARLGMVCAKNDCVATLRADNKTGWCGDHHHQRPEFKAAVAARYREDPIFREESIARARESYVRRRDAGLSVRGETSHETRMRGKHNRRARELVLFVEAVSVVRVLEDHNGLCHLCGLIVDLADWHLEHVIPLAQGGPHCYANVAPAHPACNWAKGVTTVGSPVVAIDLAARQAFLTFHGTEFVAR